MVRYLKHIQIDKLKWDKCISESENRLVYALSWYLDIVSPGWDALVEDDYTFIMPLPVRRKYIFKYLSQPYFVQQLGIFSTRHIEKKKVIEFLKKIPYKFIRTRINLNFANPVENSKYITLRNNYELNLNGYYEDIYKGYDKDYNARKLKLAKDSNLKISCNENPETFIVSYLKLSRFQFGNTFLRMLKSIMEESVKRNSGEIIMVRNTKGEILGGAFFLIHFDRIFYLVSYSSEEGKKMSSMFLIIDYIIEKYAKQNMILDFEGSIIPGVAKFMKGWGAELVKYPSYQRSLWR